MHKPVLRVTSLYLLFGTLWILLSDLYVKNFVHNNQLFTIIQIIKGWLFVFISSFVIFILVYREIKKKNQLIFLFRQSNKLYTDLLSNLPDLNIYLIDKELKHIIAHGSSLSEFGYNPADVLGKNLDEIKLPEKLTDLLEKNYKKVLNGEQITAEININEIWYEFRGIPIKGEKNETIGASAIFINISEKKQFVTNLFAQKSEIESLYEEYAAINEELTNNINKLSKVNDRLEASEKKYRMFFENINDAAYIHEVGKENEPGRFIEINQKLIEQLNYTREELFSLHPYEILNAESIPKYNNSGYWKQGMQHQYIELEHLTKNGKTIPVEVSLHYFEYEGKNLVFGTVRDIRERNKYIRKLKKAKERAEESDRLKSAFLANISHEVRTPLNGILGFSELITQLDLSKTQKSTYFSLIRKSSDQLVRIISDIIDISKIETGQMKLFYSNFSLNNLMDNLYEELNATITQNQKYIEISLEKFFNDEHDYIFVDKEKLRQVLRNILNNAEKFTRSGSIKFGYEQITENEILFFVRDTGIGLPKEKEKIVFERFRQIDDSNTREYGGMGLGLPIAKGIIELMGGRISIDSKLGESTEVCFTVPFISVDKELSEIKEIKKETSEKKSDLVGKKVLIVEDDPESSLLLSEYLGFLNGEVFTAANGSDCLEFCKKNSAIDIIFMDIRLPDLNGLDVTREIKKIIPGAYIIAQTAYSSSDDRQKCFDAGCNDYISKPIDRKDFDQKIINYLKI